MAQDKADISVIICAYTEERWNDLVAAIKSVQQQTLSPKEIVLVVDHNPKLQETVSKNISNVIVIENKESKGLSGARNSGIAATSSEIIAFIDDDAVADPNWLMMLNQVFSSPSVLGVGGAIIPSWIDKKPYWLPEEFYWVIGCSYRGLPQAVAPIRNPIGANMALRREVFEGVGGFRNNIGRVGAIPIGCEETELCIRAIQHWPQRQFLYQPKARVFHHILPQRASWQYFCRRCYAEGISKALVSQYVGTKDSLSAEHTYTLQTLPEAIVKGMISIFARRNLWGFIHIGAIIAGLIITATGYCIGKFLYKINELKHVVAPRFYLSRKGNN